MNDSSGKRDFEGVNEVIQLKKEDYPGGPNLIICTFKWRELSQGCRQKEDAMRQKRLQMRIQCAFAASEVQALTCKDQREFFRGNCQSPADSQEGRRNLSPAITRNWILPTT